MPSPKPTYDLDLVMRMIARPEGATSRQVAEAVGKPLPLVSNRLSKWRTEGRIFHAGGCSGDRPFFASAEACAAWMAANPRVEMPELITNALRAAGAAGMVSLQIAEVTGIDSKSVAGTVNRMVARGEVQVRVYKGWRLYWLAGVEVSDAAEHALRSGIDSVTAARSRAGGKARAKPGKPIRSTSSAPVIVRSSSAGQPQGEVITPQGLQPVRGQAYTHDKRYQCAPGEIPFGAGFAAAGIGRSAVTGKAWA